MSDDTDRQTVLGAITTVAPDVDPSTIDPDDDLWYALELDSMDQLGVMIAIRDRTGIEIPEAEYAALITLDDLVACLGRRRQELGG